MALSAARNTRADAPVARKLSCKMAAAKIYAGSLVMIDAGYAKPAAKATGKIIVGRARTTVDNSGGNAGDLSIDVEEGMFLWDNGTSTDACTQADVGALVYILDDHTVTRLSTGSSIAGRLMGFEGAQCVVRSFIGVA